MSHGRRLLSPDDEPRLNDALDNVIIMHGIPAAPKAKMDKLAGVIKKVLKNFEVIDIQLVSNDAGDGIGVAFVEMASPDVAGLAISKLDGYKLDKKHTFSVTLMEDFDMIMKTQPEWVAPQEDDYDEEANNLQSWLLNQESYDQVVIRVDDEAMVAWNGRTDLITVERRPNWTDKRDFYQMWSPLGSYLATIHGPGVALWGTPSWKRLARLAHKGVALIDFSPCETYLVTWSPESGVNQRDPNNIIIWDIKTGAKKGGYLPPMAGERWPVFKWSADDKHFCRRNDKGLSLYSTTDFTKASVKPISGLRDFECSPSDDIVAYWTPEEDHKPARIVLLSMSTKEELVSRNVFQVKECKLYWQASGDHLCVHVERFTKSKKNTFADFQLFYLREKLIPCDQHQVSEDVHGFYWEPKGSRIEKRKINDLFSLDGAADNLYWSPQGRFCVIAQRFKMEGQLRFVDVDEREAMATREHSMCTEVLWDPTGRYVASEVSGWKQTVDTGFIMWSFSGNQIYKMSQKGFKQLQWRPRPPSLIDAKDEKQIKRDWRDYQSRFEAADRLSQAKASAEVVAQRRATMEQWEAYRSKVTKRLASFKSRMESLRSINDGETVHLEEVMEVMTKEERELV